MREIWRIITFSKQLGRYYAGISLFTILLAVVAQLQPLLTKGAIDEISNLLNGGQANVTLVAVFAILIFVTDVLQTLLSNFGGHIGDIMAAKLKHYLGHRYYQHILGLSQRYFDTELSGKIINRMNRGIGQIGDFMHMLSNNFLQFLFSTLLSLAIVAYFSWQVALMLAALYPAFIWLTMRSSGKWIKYQTEKNTQYDVASGRFAESIGQVRVVKSFLQEMREIKFFDKYYNKATKINKPQSVHWHKQDVIRRLVLNVIFLAVFVYIFVEAARGTYTIGTMVLLIQYALQIRIPIFTISFLVDQTQRAVANSRDFFEVMDTAAEVADLPGAKKLQVTRGGIAFDDVYFGYDADKPVLKGVSFTAKPGTKVALVGESGQGKTTITNLLLRLYDVKKGEITIDGQNVGEVTQESLRASIGVVFQEPALFSGTIGENIGYATTKASQKQIEQAAKAANAHEFIKKFEKGYDTEIGERGLRLSGGQKQRIAIARALLKDAPILILDEATSSLDSKSEHQVQQALQRLMKNRTVIIIAHRLSTIQHVDQIVTISGGKVSQTGTPQELAGREGVYAELLKLQQAPTEQTQKQLKKYEITG